MDELDGRVLTMDGLGGQVTWISLVDKIGGRFG